MKVKCWIEKWEYEKETRETENLHFLYVDELSKAITERNELNRKLQTVEYRIAKLCELLQNEE